MSYFLEDTNSKYETGILVDYTGINEAMFNAEIAWHNIMETAMKTEYQAIKNEDANLLENAVTDFFAKAKQWFKDLFASITRVILNIKNRITLAFDSYGKMALALNKKVKRSKKTKATTGTFTTIKVSDVKVNGKNISEIADELHKMAQDIYNDNTTDIGISNKDTFKSKKTDTDTQYQAIMKALKQSNAKNTSTDLATFETYFNNDIQDLIKSKAVIKNALNDFETARKSCKKGMDACDKEKKDEIKVWKYKSSYINKCSSRYLNMKIKYFQCLLKNCKNYVKALFK